MDKQIEEMARELREIQPLFYASIAEQLYNAGYRKSTENAVVIEKSEYEKLRLLADECLEWRRKNCNVGELPKENAVVLTDEEYSDMLSAEVETIKRDIAEYWATEAIEIVAKELHKDGYRKLDDHAICVLRKAKCLEYKIRKETAEKLLNKVDYESNGQTKAITDLLRKEYGVETK